jgi:hypothetical protein
MIDVSVKVPEERIADFYSMLGRWLAGSDLDAANEEATAEVVGWSDTAEDAALAKVVWSKFSARAKGMFSTLMDDPEKRFSGEDLADLLDIPNGKYGVAGVLAWPGRHCLAVNRSVPCRYEDGPKGGSANYWMDSEIASLFRKVRDAQ